MVLVEAEKREGVQQDRVAKETTGARHDYFSRGGRLAAGGWWCWWSITFCERIALVFLL